jgi:hypothetical protein
MRDIASAPPVQPQPPDLDHTRKFLGAIDRGPAPQFDFRTVDDRGDDPRKSVKAHGTPDCGVRLHSDTAKNGKPCRPLGLLTYMQQLLAGAFFLPNETDGEGQKQQNVKRIRCLFVDADTREAVERLRAFVAKTGLIPTVVVESGGLDQGVPKLHAYWVITGCEVSQFRDAQLTLVSRLGTDPAVQDAGRVMRLPGFWHLKREPRMTRAVEFNGVVYAFASFMARVKAEPQIVDPWAGGKGRGRPAGGRVGSGMASGSAGPTARLRVLLDRYGGLVTPAVRALLREAAAPSDTGPGNRHATLVSITARCTQAGWSDADMRTLVLPVVNTEWADGDWGAHLDSILAWTRQQETAAIAASTSAPAALARAFQTGGTP